MNKLLPYLTFNGNCREAMHFYQRCLGGELKLQCVGDTPMARNFPPEVKQYILHASLTSNAIQLLASDMVSETGLVRGNSISLMLYCSSEDELRKFYAALSDRGTQTHPVESTAWGALFGNLVDRYDNHWLLHFQK